MIKKIVKFFMFSIIFLFIADVSGNTEPKLNLAVEIGAGDMLGLYAVMPIKGYSVFLGLGGSFTYIENTYFETDVNEYYYSYLGMIGGRVFQKDVFSLSLRDRFGVENIRADEFYSYGFYTIPEIQVGWKQLYGLISVPVFFGQEKTAVVFRLGVGYNIKLF